MTFRDRFYLTWSYGKAQLVVGFAYNLFCLVVLSSAHVTYALFVDAFILKFVVYPMTFYLVKQLRDRDTIFFYINLGLSPRRLQLGVFLIDFLSFAFILTIILMLHG